MQVAKPQQLHLLQAQLENAHAKLTKTAWTRGLEKKSIHESSSFENVQNHTDHGISNKDVDSKVKSCKDFQSKQQHHFVENEVRDEYEQLEQSYTKSIEWNSCRIPNPTTLKSIPPIKLTINLPMIRTDGQSDQLQVIGVGQMRTGTTSLKRALEIMYGVPCYHMSDLLFKGKQEDIWTWIQLCNTPITTLNKYEQAFWDHLYKGHQCAVDYPTCLFYEQLMRIYPNAKFILTMRNPDDWVQSCRATTLQPYLTESPNIGTRLYHWFLGLEGLHKLHQLMFKRALGSNYATITDAELTNAFIRWNAKVRATIPSDRLLEFNVDQGWDPLYKFLNLPLLKLRKGEPNVQGQLERIPFPHLNKRKEMKTRMDQFQHSVKRMNVCMLILCTTLFLTLLFCWWCSNFT